MIQEIVIDAATGALRIGTLATLGAGAAMAEAAAALAPFALGERDFGNGYTWLAFRGLSFGGRPCALSLCFLHSRFAEASWGVEMADGAADGSWPTREECDLEIAFVRAILREQTGRAFAKGSERFAWGELWSSYDPKGGGAGHGLRYL